jgi:hypothetical protein
MTRTWSPAMLDHFAAHAIDPRVATALGLEEWGGRLTPKARSVVLWIEPPRDFVLLAATLEDALAIATVIYAATGGKLVRKAKLPGALEVASVAVLPAAAAPPRRVAAEIRKVGPESLVVVFAGRPAAHRLKHRLSHSVRSVWVQPNGESYGASLAAIPEADRAERLAGDIVTAVIADAKAIANRLLDPKRERK